MARRTEPVRTCVGCRRRAARAGLLRIVVVDGELVPDVHRRLPGRGAHLHPDPACLDLAERRKAFPRAFRVTGPLLPARVRAHVDQAGVQQAGNQRAGNQRAGNQHAAQ